MTINFTEKEFLKVYKGNTGVYCHIDALHAASPNADLFTDEIVERIIEKTGCSGIIGTISRTVADLNRRSNGQNDAALLEYRNTIKEIVQHLEIWDEQNIMISKPYLHLSIHGMKDIHHGSAAIEIGTSKGKSCSSEIMDWFYKTVNQKSQEIIPGLNIVLDQKFDGDESIVFHRLGDGNDYRGYGNHFHTFQIEIARSLREDHQEEIAELISQIIRAW